MSLESQIFSPTVWCVGFKLVIVKKKKFWEVIMKKNYFTNKNF